MNVLQHVDITKYGPIFSTLNPRHDLKHDLIQARIAYDHPAFDASALRSQRSMPLIQNQRAISFAGAWMGYAFHEDGITTGLEAAQRLGGVNLPFPLKSPDREVRYVWLAELFDMLESLRVLSSKLKSS
ncbi:hypothetical protein M408DRAFT_18694 [Serendipita vermifera MAFF 305830]|uniref:Amine oxidase domain-containing protein n=1 Tax=Serendipita vermifera MAFF 305830 TaxID=933852 RepID=A0A0C2WQ30_SERVB|nr:hypothetical protein M408DRAFT_18694 [Serendipita vermifera MAFF 305830]